MSADLDIAVRKRSGSAGWLTKATKLCDDLAVAIRDKEDVDEEDVTNALENFEKRLISWENYQSEVELHCEEVNLENEIEKASRFRNGCVAKKLHLRKEWKKTTVGDAGSNGHSVNESTVRLPKLELPKFYGEPLKFTAFWQRFESGVENQDISEVSKFNYLVACLKGKAKAVLEGLPITSEHYATAKELIHRRFGRKEALIFAHVQALLQLYVPEVKEVEKLTTFSDELLAHVRALAALEISSDKFGVILTPLIVTKLPEEIRMEWSRGSEEKEGDLIFLLDFLEKEISRRKRSLPFSAPPPEKKPPPGPAGRGGGSALLGLGADNTVSCKFCGKKHPTLRCFKFRDSAPKERQVMVGNAGLCFRCLDAAHQAKSCTVTCGRCGKPHHESLCFAKKSEGVPPQGREEKKFAGEAGDGEQGSGLLTMDAGVTILPTIKIKVQGKNDWFEITALLDSGSSKSYVSRKIVQKIKPKWLRRTESNCSVFGGLKMKSMRDVYEVRVQSLEGEKTFCVTEVPVICAPLCTPKLKDCSMRLFDDLTIANHFAPQGSIVIDMLIGLDLYWEVVKSGVVRSDNGVVAQETIFGWVLSGSESESSSTEAFTVQSLLSLEDIPEGLQHCFWDLDSIGVGAKEEVDLVLQKFLETVRFVEDEGRYEVALTYKSPFQKLELKDNKVSASRLNDSLERRLGKDPKLEEQYHRALREMEELDFIEEVEVQADTGKQGSVFYLPHHPCIREESSTTKVRPVFNASSKGPNGVSLNDCLESGPNLNPTVMEVLLRFRRWPVALSTDITKAFLQILLRPEDRDVHRFLWTVDGRTRVMRFKRVTFGICCSPFLLAAVVRYHLSLCVTSRAVTELLENCYVDDLLTGDNTELGAHSLFLEANEIMSKAGMTLAKWDSNQIGIIGDTGSSAHGIGEFRKILGIYWDSATDEFKFCGVELPDPVVCTKRAVLAMIARVYDPLGLILPFTVLSKFLFQTIWRLGTTWDEVLPVEVAAEFRSRLHEIQELKSIRIPRQYFPGPWSVEKLQVFAFGDASVKGYGACVYLSYELPGENQVILVKSCARVAPLQRHTLPRLELLGALITSRLVDYVKTKLHLPQEVPYFCFTDSMITLGWIRSSPNQWKPWVANRVAEIQQLTCPESWFHCPGTQNPADLLTRGCSGSKLAECELWWKGPPFLKNPDLKSKILKLSVDHMDIPAEAKVEMKRAKSDSVVSCEEDSTRSNEVVSVALDDNSSILERSSSLYKAYVTLGWIYRFVSNVRAKLAKKPLNVEKQLTSEEFSNVQLSFLRLIQKQHFSYELECLKKKRSVPSESKLSKLKPFIDGDGLLRVSSRITLSELSYESKNPIILPKCREVLLLVRFKHYSMNHAGVNTLIAAIQAKYEIFGLRNMVKKLKKNCVACQRVDSLACDQEESPLPRLRVTKAPAFTVTGIDLAGPVYCVDSQEKFYICLFVCGVVRAVHLELVESQSREDFMLAYRRFAALKRAPSIVYSDNAKNFTSAKKLLRQYLGPLTPEWRLICPRSPWWGGWWERLVRSTKSALRKTLGRNYVTKVELQTCLHEVAASINSRPLTFVGTDIDVPSPLTPNHFLSGSGRQGLENVVEDVDQVSRRHLVERDQEMVQRLDEFWQIWSSEYLRNLPPCHQKFRKRGHLEVGSIVLVKEDGLPRMKWVLGRVLRLHVGRDGLPRAADLKTKSGMTTRPIQKLYHLEIEESIDSAVDDVEESRPSTVEVQEVSSPNEPSSDSQDQSSGTSAPGTTAASGSDRPKRRVRLPMKYANFDMS